VEAFKSTDQMQKGRTLARLKQNKANVPKEVRISMK